MLYIRLLFLLCCFLCYSLPSLAKERIVVIYNWSEYIPRSVIEDFQKETGIRVIYSTYESNEAMLAKLQILKGKGYDVIVPSTYVVPPLQQSGLLEVLDTKKLPNLKHLDPYFLEITNTKDTLYTIPYMWGTTVLLYNKAQLHQDYDSWNQLFQPELSKKIFLSDDMRDTFGVALMAQNLSPNETDPQKIAQGGAWLKKLFPLVYIFDITAQKQAFINEEVLIGTAWNGDAFIAIQENPSLTAVYPKEGSPMWIDSFAITTNAENKEEAYSFINYMLRPDVAARCVQEYNYSTPNKDAIPLLPANLKNSPLVNPSQATILKLKLMTGVGNAINSYEKLWESLKVTQ